MTTSEPLPVTLRFDLQTINLLLKVLQEAPMPHKVSDPLLKYIVGQAREQTAVKSAPAEAESTENADTKTNAAGVDAPPV